MAEQGVLIIDSDVQSRDAIVLAVVQMGLSVSTVSSIQEAMLYIKQHAPLVCITEAEFDDGSALDLIRFTQQQTQQTPIIIATQQANVEDAVEAMKVGAVDYLAKPLVRSRLQTAMAAIRQAKDASVSSSLDTIRGDSVVMQKLKAQIVKLARIQAPIYIHGESGSGKELVAKQIHLQGARAQGAFIPVNCGAIPENLMESEFFGHQKGSFTGAIEDKEGLFQAAHQGTLFLDEVADLPLAMQVKLLRAIQEGAIKPVGGTKEIAVNIRLLSATHKNLEEEVHAGRFRQDLYYRLNVITLDIPPLRERKEDIPLLVDFFIEKITTRWQMPTVTLSTAAMDALQHYPFLGNVRELENTLERAIALCEGEQIEVSDLQLRKVIADTTPIVDTAATKELAIGEIPEGVWNPDGIDAEKDLVLRALQYTHWNRSQAARILGMTFRQLTYRVQKYKLTEHQ